MTILVTGATGYLGSGLIPALRAAGHRAVGASRTSPEGPDSFSLDITSADDCRRVMQRVKPDAVIHAAALAHVGAAARSREAARLVNTQGTINVLAAAVEAGARRFVFTSSVLVYGENPLPARVSEDDPVRPSDAYAASKADAERACAERAGDIEVVVLRMATMYSADWTYNTRRRVRPLGPIPLGVLVDPDRPRFSLCSLQNGVAAALAGAEGRLGSGTYNVADDCVYSQRQILEAVARNEGPLASVRLPRWVPWSIAGLVQLVPIASARARAGALYWKYCEANVFDTSRLAAAGMRLDPHLLPRP